MSAGPTPTTVAPSKGKVFARRLASSAALWAVVVLGLSSDNLLIAHGVFLLAMLVLAVAGLAEFYGLAEKSGLRCFSGWGVTGGVLLMLGTFLHTHGWLGAAGSAAQVNDFETGFLILFVLGLCVRQFLSRDGSRALPTVAVTLLGLMYVPWLLNFIQKINFFPGLNGTLYLLYFIVVTKCSDIGAYCVGSLIGRHKMIPRVSPGKTWEGFGGAILVSTGASLLFAHLAGERLAGMTLRHAVILGVLLSIAAVVGDLIESIFKREAGVKDSGRFFPGIGGILDLLDSLLFNAPLMYLYLRHVLAS
jgi:phosphatidate cytidylyltransferase